MSVLTPLANHARPVGKGAHQCKEKVESRRERWTEKDFKRKNVRSDGKPSAFKVPHLDFI